MARNALVHKENMELGLKTENLFEEVAKKENFIVLKSSLSEDRYKHIDFFLEQDHFKYSVDVKARKKTNRDDAKVNDEWTWIEFKNVLGRKGWLYGEADYIAFERADDFLMVNRENLVKFCEDKVDLETMVSRAYQAEYKVYQRQGRRDLITRIRMDDLTNLEGNIILQK
mgnify:FL=1|tara:strand:- start:31 stop:540 length:510 start_codon:yes stop_codon:yes gene_type:complete